MRFFTLCFCCLFAAALMSAEHRIAQTSKERHARLRLAYAEPQEGAVHLEKLRYMLGKKGITWDANFATDMMGNPSGGRARGFTYAGSYGLSVNIHGDNFGWKGGDLFSSMVWRTGTSLSQRKIDNQFPVQQVFGSQTVKLNELYLSQTAFENRFEMKVGRLDAGNDFFASPLYGRFVNNAFDGNPISIFFNVPFTAYPNSTWGAYTMFKPFKRLSIKTAVFNANSNIKKNKYHGVNFTFKSTNGVIWITEWDFLVNQEKEDQGMPGNYKVGYFYLTGKVDRFSGGKQKGDPCFYLLFDQMIYQKEGTDRGLTPFVSLIFTPKNRNLFPFFLDAGLVFKGPFNARPDDYLNFGYVYGKYSTDKSDIDTQRGLAGQNFESVIEAGYWFQINPSFYIMPDFQYIIRPKGFEIPDAVVIGAQIGFDL